MLQRFRIPFKLEEEGKERKNRSFSPGHAGSVDVGLQILVHISHGKSNVVVKSAMKPKRHTSPSTNFCYLKTCHLCFKKLSLDKDVYMYRGDQGFCSIECRNRQIVLDEMKELEISTKQRVASYRHCSSAAGRCETRRLLEDLRRQRKPPTHANHWTIFS